MKTLVLRKEIEPLPKQLNESFVTEYEGFLNSNYKRIAKANFFHSKPGSIFNTRQRLKSNLYTYSSSIDAILKLTIFGIVLTAII